MSDLQFSLDERAAELEEVHMYCCSLKFHDELAHILSAHKALRCFLPFPSGQTIEFVYTVIG